jgi:hypothetical protein
MEKRSRVTTTLFVGHRADMLVLMTSMRSHAENSTLLRQSLEGTKQMRSGDLKHIK